MDRPEAAENALFLVLYANSTSDAEHATLTGTRRVDLINETGVCVYQCQY